jgi:hypothetical protein
VAPSDLPGEGLPGEGPPAEGERRVGDESGETGQPGAGTGD